MKFKLCVMTISLLAHLNVVAQEECRVVSVKEGGAKYEVMLAGETVNLFSEAAMSQLAADYRESLASNETLLRRCGDTLNANDGLLREYEAAMAKVRKLSEELLELSAAHSALNQRFVSSLASHTALLEEYDALAGRYRRSALRTNATFATRAGVGINNSDTSDNWDLFLGLEVFQFDAWLYGNSDQQGLGLGLSF